MLSGTFGGDLGVLPQGPMGVSYNNSATNYPLALWIIPIKFEILTMLFKEKENNENLNYPNLLPPPPKKKKKIYIYIYMDTAKKCFYSSVLTNNITWLYCYWSWRRGMCIQEWEPSSWAPMGATYTTRTTLHSLPPTMGVYLWCLSIWHCKDWFLESYMDNFPLQYAQIHVDNKSSCCCGQLSWWATVQQ